MEHLFQILNQLFEILNLLQGSTEKEREELVDNYRSKFNSLVELVIQLEWIIKGETPFGRPVKWGRHLWQLHTYKRQHGLTLQAGWDDVVDFGIPLGRIVKVVIPRRYDLQSVSPTQIEGHRPKINSVSDVCKIDYVPQLQKLVLSEAVVDILNPSSSEDDDRSSSESETVRFDIDNLSTDELDSTSDSLPDLVDRMGHLVGGIRRVYTRRTRAARLNIPFNPAQAWRDLFSPIHPTNEGQLWR